MKTENLVRNIEGLHTLESLKTRLGIDTKKAIYLMYMLRKKGYVKTKYDSSKKRLYYVSRMNLAGGNSYMDFLNKDSPIKLYSSLDYYIHGRKIAPEEVLIYALKRNTIRHIIASLALFRKIKDWGALYRMAKKENLARKIGALYDVARLFVSKVRRMPKRFRNNAMPKKGDKYIYIIDEFSSDSFRDIEKKWRVYIPLNAADLEDYKHD